jgi:hypothetical protein
LRAVLVAILVNGLVPAFGEAVEAVVHYAETGHLAHGAGEEDLGDLGREHGCGGAEHHCVCCPSLAVALPSGPSTGSRVDLATRVSPDDAGPPTARSLEPPYRPPIA